MRVQPRTDPFTCCSSRIVFATLVIHICPKTSINAMMIVVNLLIFCSLDAKPKYWKYMTKCSCELAFLNCPPKDAHPLTSMHY